ncbi:LacI family transcriptional regulator [Paenibacillus hemerocallicola]|jgi:LacI family transcriptional regulator|uniref:LacI family transcriptional regulator n=1 Tax=Paenibacillus hemerocallicola TaxID=1172614 RepID=A0A5C4T678_9BACL|nr:LacI family transcriptional regulator [Paenibacillus hemerocallicola]
MLVPTIKDIAKLAGVTFVSVSRALNNEPGVSEETRRKILDIAKQINYVPNLAAKRLVDRSSNGIGLIWPKREEPFFYRTCNQIQEEAAARGFTVMVSFAEREEALRSFREFFIGRAICWLDKRSTPEYTEAKEQFRGKVLEVGGRERWKQENAHWLDIDRKGAIKQAMSHLFELGHTRIAFLGGHSDKWLGYTESLVELGLEFSPELNVMTLVGNPDMPQKVRDFVHNYSEYGATAIVIDSEAMLREFVKTAYVEGVRIPEQLSVAVYDDVPETQSLLPIPITTVGPDIVGLARTIIDLITVEADAAEEGLFFRKMIETELKVRESTRQWG